MEENYYVYLMFSSDACEYKIGYARDPVARCERIKRTVLPSHVDYHRRQPPRQGDKSIELISVSQPYTKDTAITVEGVLHKIYSRYRVEGEWFSLDEEQVRTIIYAIEEE